MTSNRRSLAQALTFGALYGNPPAQSGGHLKSHFHWRQKFQDLVKAQEATGVEVHDLNVAALFDSFKQFMADPEARARTPRIVLDSYSEGNSEGVPVQVRTSQEYEFPPTKSMLYYHVQSALMQWFPPEVQ